MNSLSNYDSFAGYVKYVNNIPQLSASEEKEMFIEFFNGNIEIAKKIALHNLRYVIWFVNNDFATIPIPKEDLVQMGNIGLLKAIKKFKLEHGVRFISYAKYWIMYEIKYYITKNFSMIRKFKTKPQLKLLYNAANYDWENLKMKDVAKISKEMGVSKNDVMLFESSYNESFVDIDDAVNDINYDYINLASINSPESLVEDADNIKRFNIFQEAMMELSDRSKDIILSRHKNSKMTLGDLSKKYNISIERIRQIEKESIKSMKQWVLEKYPDHLEYI